MRALVLAALLAASPAAGADYVRIALSVPVARAPDKVWATVGSYCAISAWMKVSCDFASGNGDVGTVRRLKDATIDEVMVAKTSRSYTYWQTKGTMALASYHGTLAVEPDGRASRLTYTLFYDQSALASDAVRESEHARLTGRFTELLGVMKGLAEAR